MTERDLSEPMQSTERHGAYAALVAGTEPRDYPYGFGYLYEAAQGAAMALDRGDVTWALRCLRDGLTVADGIKAARP